jgi:hypothetical protein
VTPLWAERVRTVLFTVLATAGTVLLLRILFRASRGDLSADDPEPWAFAGTVALAVVWARAMKRVRRAPSSPEGSSPDETDTTEPGKKGPDEAASRPARPPRTGGYDPRS